MQWQREYSNHPNLWGFELLNEPSQYYSSNDHQVLVQFYKESYSIIREHSADAVVIFNELYAQYYSYWNSELHEPDYYNVAMDLHLYDWLIYTRVELPPRDGRNGLGE